MVKKILCQGYLWLLLLLLYAPIFIIMIYSFTEAKVLGNWTGFSTKLYSSLFVAGTHHSLTKLIALRARGRRLNMPIAVILPSKVDTVAAIKAMLKVLTKAFVNE